MILTFIAFKLSYTSVQCTACPTYANNRQIAACLELLHSDGAAELSVVRASARIYHQF